MLKVLLVDDEFLVRLAFANTIHWEEHELELIGTASDGEEAYEMILKEKPDIVITDLTMPRMGGLELVKKVQSVHIPCEFVVLSCHNEFEYAKEAIKLGVFDYILKLSMNMEELLDILDRLRNKILSERPGIHPIPELMEQQEISNAEFQVVVVDYGSAMDEDAEKIHNQILSFLEQITGEIKNKSVFLYKQIPVLLIWNEDMDIKPLLREVQEEIRKYLGIWVQIGIGSCVQGNIHIRESFNEARKAYEFRFYQGETSLCDSADIRYLESEINFNYVFPEIADAVHLGICGELKSIILKALEECQKRADIEPVQLRMYLHELLTRVKLKANEQKPGVIQGKEYSELYQKVNRLEYLEDIRNDLMYFIDQILERLDLEQEHEIVRKTKAYVHAHLNGELKVLEVSKQLGVNPDYLSHLFRTETGVRYIDYVNHARIEKACERLSVSNDKIYEIGEQTGFENTNYFIRVFKKHTGYTPLDYRKNLENMRGQEMNN